MRTKILATTALVVSSLLLAACSDGGGIAAGSSATTLGGTAAVGAPIAGGTVSVTCAGGSPLSTTTASNGAWQVTTSGQTLPCAVQVNGGTIGGSTNSTPYHSIAMSFGTVNITPLTDLVVANLAGRAPSTWFAGLSAAVLQEIKAATVDTALGKVNTALSLGATLNGTNPLTTPFSAVNGNLIDDILEAMAAAISNAGFTYADFLARATQASFTVPENFNFSSAYAAVASANAPVSCAAGEIAMTYSGSGPYTAGQKLCFTASTTSLAFSGKTLTNPTQNTVVQAPYSAYKFVDGTYFHEVVFNAGNLYEINVSNATQFLGQFAVSASGGTGGTGNLVVQVTVSGIGSPAISLSNIPVPGSQSEFCGALANDSTFQGIGASGGGTLTINSCSFANKVGTANATLAITTPFAMTLPYTITYTYQ